MKVVYEGGVGAAIDGSYYKAGTSPGSGVAMGIQTTFSTTTNVLICAVNTSSDKKVIMDYIRLLCTATGATTTSSHIAVYTDNVNRYSSGGTLLQPANVSGYTGDSKMLIRVGAVAAVSPSNPRLVGRAAIRQQAAPCWAVNDQIYLTFRGGISNGYSVITGTGPVIVPVPCSPAILSPGQSLLVHMWNIANATTAPSWEFELGWMEI